MVNKTETRSLPKSVFALKLRWNDKMVHKKLIADRLLLHAGISEAEEQIICRVVEKLHRGDVHREAVNSHRSKVP